MKSRAYLDEIEERDGVQNRDAKALEAAARAVADGADPKSLGPVIDAYDVYYRANARVRLHDIVAGIVDEHFKSVARAAMTLLPKDNGYRCRSSYGLCSRRPRSGVGAYTVCWQHEVDAIRIEARRIRADLLGPDDIGPDIRGYRVALSVADIWDALRARIAIARSLPLNAGLADALNDAVTAFTNDWEGL